MLKNTVFWPQIMKNPIFDRFLPLKSVWTYPAQQKRIVNFKSIQKLNLWRIWRSNTSATLSADREAWFWNGVLLRDGLKKMARIAQKIAKFLRYNALRAYRRSPDYLYTYYFSTFPLRFKTKITEVSRIFFHFSFQRVTASLSGTSYFSFHSNGLCWVKEPQRWNSIIFSKLL